MENFSRHVMIIHRCTMLDAEAVDVDQQTKRNREREKILAAC